MRYYIVDMVGLHEHYVNKKETVKNLTKDLTWTNKFILRYDDNDKLIPGSEIESVTFTSITDKNYEKHGSLAMLTTTNPDGVLGNEVVFTDIKNKDERLFALDERSMVNIVLSIVAYLMEFEGIDLDVQEPEESDEEA